MRTSLVMLIALALLVFASLSLQMGMLPVPWRALLTDWRPDSTHYYVLMEYRLPRLILAIFVGAAYKALYATRWPHRTFSASTMRPVLRQ